MKELATLSKAHQYILKGRVALEARQRMTSDGTVPDWLTQRYADLERDIEKEISSLYKDHILYDDLRRIKGLGLELAPKFLGFIESIENNGTTGIACFDTVSRFWAFCGYGQAIKPIAGQKLNYNTELKSHLFKIGTSFMKARNQFYERIYLPRKDYEATKFEAIVEAKRGKSKGLPEGVTTQLHIHNRALRYMIKFFLACLYYHWRERLNIPSRPLYSIEWLKHNTMYRLEEFYDQ